MLNEIKSFATSLWARLTIVREDGQAMVEYSLILALISIVAIAALTTIGTDVRSVFETVVTELGKVV
jgi:pilus assembly protein Flp/PilA